ncbi:MAG: OadG family protein [Propionibacteriaceae bacterium]|nr:OadG family protein [Propionibacteriaceae bacterium]
MENLTFGLWATLVGMGTVLAILVLLMLVLYGIGALDKLAARRAAPPTPASTELTADEQVAIAVAVAAHHQATAAAALPAVPPATGPGTVAEARGSGTVATERALRATATGPDTVAAHDTVAAPDADPLPGPTPGQYGWKHSWNRGR